MDSRGLNKQVLDKLKVERERGITGKLQQIIRNARLIMCQVKAQTARLVILLRPQEMRFYGLTGTSMFHQQNNLRYLLNLIDTPVCGTFSAFIACQLTCLRRVMLISPGRSPVQWLPARVPFFLSMQVKASRRSLCRYFMPRGKEVLR